MAACHRATKGSSTHAGSGGKGNEGVSGLVKQTPGAIGYVELPGEVKVETRLTESDPDALAIGMEMELTLVPFRTDDNGNEVVTFAFRPVQGAAS